MRVFMNFKEVRGPYGGANSFLRTLRAALERGGVRVTTRLDDRFDVALLNALSHGIDVRFVERVAERVPVVHRKVGYRASGPPDLRAEVDGVIEGDRRQIEFSPYVTHTIFQSGYSREVFLASGFRGEHTVIHNGVDDRVFSPLEPRGLLRRSGLRAFWTEGSPMRVIVVAWSTDANKGFAEYARVDETLAGRTDVEMALVGRIPEGFRPRHIRRYAARPSRRLPPLLRRQHVVLQLARHETCSNALLEALACGLPAIYLDSGSNDEIAGEYGVVYEGDLFAALERLKPRYREIVEKLVRQPFRIGPVADRYLAVLERVASGERAVA